VDVQELATAGRALALAHVGRPARERGAGLAELAGRTVPLDGALEPAAAGRRLHLLAQAYASAGDEVMVGVPEILDGCGEATWAARQRRALEEFPTARLVVVTGPIAAGKSTVADALAADATARGRTAVVVDVDDVAEAVVAPGAGATGLWFSAHQAHGALVGRWCRTPVDLVVAVGPIYSAAEQDALLTELPAGLRAHWVLLEAPVTTTLDRARRDPTRGVSREEGFHRRCHERFGRLRPGVPADQRFDTAGTGVAEIVAEVSAVLFPDLGETPR
jgi:hypothetical protein